MPVLPPPIYVLSNRIVSFRVFSQYQQGLSGKARLRTPTTVSIDVFLNRVRNGCDTGAFGFCILFI